MTLVLVGAFFMVLMIISLHVILDFICALCCLFPHYFAWPYAATLYVSIFRETLNNENAALSRALVYWAAAMSLVRLLALVFLSFDLFAAVVLMYVLEGLVAEYEGFTAGTIKHRTARLISLFSFGIALVITVLLCSNPLYL